jgi:hypothetical protein
MKYLKTYKLYENLIEIPESVFDNIIDILQNMFDEYNIFSYMSKNLTPSSKYWEIVYPNQINICNLNKSEASCIMEYIKSTKENIESFIGYKIDIYIDEFGVHDDFYYELEDEFYTYSVCIDCIEVL